MDGESGEQVEDKSESVTSSAKTLVGDIRNWTRVCHTKLHCTKTTTVVKVAYFLKISPG